jgi:hypothetical protein
LAPSKILALRAVVEVLGLDLALLEEEDGEPLVPSLARARVTRVGLLTLESSFAAVPRPFVLLTRDAGANRPRVNPLTRAPVAPIAPVRIGVTVAVHQEELPAVEAQPTPTKPPLVRGVGRHNRVTHPAADASPLLYPTAVGVRVHDLADVVEVLGVLLPNYLDLVLQGVCLSLRMLIPESSSLRCAFVCLGPELPR